MDYYQLAVHTCKHNKYTIGNCMKLGKGEPCFSVVIVCSFSYQACLIKILSSSTRDIVVGQVSTYFKDSLLAICRMIF